MAFYPLDNLVNLHDGYRRVFTIGRQQLLLLQDAGQVYLIKNECPHLGQPLHQASLNNGLLRCPGHGIEFELQTGQPRSPTQPCPALTYFQLTYEGNQLGVEVN